MRQSFSDDRIGRNGYSAGVGSKGILDVIKQDFHDYSPMVLEQDV